MATCQPASRRLSLRRLFWRHTVSHFATLAVPKHSPPACRIAKDCGLWLSIARRCFEGSQGIYPLDHETVDRSASRSRRIDSSKQIPLVVIDAMPVEKGQALLQKSFQRIQASLTRRRTFVMDSFPGDESPGYCQASLSVAKDWRPWPLTL